MGAPLQGFREGRSDWLETAELFKSVGVQSSKWVGFGFGYFEWAVLMWQSSTDLHKVVWPAEQLGLPSGNNLDTILGRTYDSLITFGLSCMSFPEFRSWYLNSFFPLSPPSNIGVSIMSIFPTKPVLGIPLGCTSYWSYCVALVFPSFCGFCRGDSTKLHWLLVTQ